MVYIPSSLSGTIGISAKAIAYYSLISVEPNCLSSHTGQITIGYKTIASNSLDYIVDACRHELGHAIDAAGFQPAFFGFATQSIQLKDFTPDKSQSYRYNYAAVKKFGDNDAMDNLWGGKAFKALALVIPTYWRDSATEQFAERYKISRRAESEFNSLLATYNSKFGARAMVNSNALNQLFYKVLTRSYVQLY
jgi:hypothetical protein